MTRTLPSRACCSPKRKLPKPKPNSAPRSRFSRTPRPSTSDSHRASRSRKNRSRPPRNSRKTPRSIPTTRAPALTQAGLLADAGKDDEALAALDTAAAANGGKESPQTLKLRAAILYRKKAYAAVVPVLQQLIALEPKNPDYPAELGHALLEKKDAAVNELIVALTMNPKSDDVLKDLILSEYLAKKLSRRAARPR